MSLVDEKKAGPYREHARSCASCAAVDEKRPGAHERCAEGVRLLIAAMDDDEDAAPRGDGGNDGT